MKNLFTTRARKIAVIFGGFFVLTLVLLQIQNIQTYLQHAAPLTPPLTGPTTTVTPSINPSISPMPTNTPFPSTTPIAQNTKFSLDLLFHGIGNGGDSQAPGSAGNFTPLDPQRTITLKVLNNTDADVTTATGQVLFNETTGGFSGTISLPIVLQPGAYTIKIKSPHYLQKLLPGFTTITVANQTSTIQLPQTTLILGDSNNDNAIDILDYGMVIDCFSVLLGPKDCADPIKKAAADLNDDNKIDGTDLNLFIRNVKNRNGD